jgi:RNA polymerase sigma-70 factor (ECF subfamily)
MASLTATRLTLAMQPSAPPTQAVVVAGSQTVDPAVLSRAQGGDRAAQAILLRDLQDVLFRFCLAMLRDPETARDATQETALRFLQRLASFRGDAVLRTWALGIALNVCREARRARPALALTDDHETPSREAPPESHAAEGEDRQAMRVMIEGLPERQREAVVLRYYEGMSVEATAESMGCAEGTVKATISQALRALRNRWKDRR